MTQLTSFTIPAARSPRPPKRQPVKPVLTQEQAGLLLAIIHAERGEQFAQLHDVIQKAYHVALDKERR
jgi:hypothetical protein